MKKDKFNSLDDEDGETTDEAIEAWDLAIEAKFSRSIKI